MIARSIDARSDSDTAQPDQQSPDNVADALKMSELRYRRLFESARDGILILESDQGKITDANPFMTELLGYSHDELIGKELWEIGLLKDKAAELEAFQYLKEHGYIRYEDLPLQNRRGDRREVEFVSNVYRENDRNVIQCNIRDITERKRMDVQLAAAATKNEHIAETLQRSMLLKSPANKFPGIAVETLYEATLNEASVGGDFFDAFALAGDKVALVVGDVSGKGLAAAGRTAEVKYALRAFLHEYKAPEVALTLLNDFICETYRLDKDETGTFIILALAVVNTVTGETTFSAAGAEPTLIVRLDGRAESVDVFGQGLGMLPDAVYVAQTTVLGVGETILMTTDGITEARNGNEFLGYKGVASLAENAGTGMSLSEFSRSIYDAACDFTDNGFNDDVCLLVARRQ